MSISILQQASIDRINAWGIPHEPPESKVLSEIPKLLWNRKGKRLRAQMVYWGAKMAGLSPTAVDVYAWAVEALHTATLLHDDVMDVAELRRGGPSANALFDNSLPILAGDFLLSDVIDRVAITGNTDILKGLCRTLKEITTGECLQYENRYRIPEDSSIKRIAELKTASLLAWSFSIGGTLASDKEIEKLAVEIGTRFGVFFQFTDDALDLLGSTEKERGVDLREGKVNRAMKLLLSVCPDIEPFLLREFNHKFLSKELLSEIDQRLVKSEFRKTLRAEMEKEKHLSLALCEALPDREVRAIFRTLFATAFDRCFIGI